MYKVYLVDDDGLILEEMATTVAWLDNGFEVAGSNTNPLKAIDEIRTLSPDVIFCDLKMPVMDGNEFIRQLREDGVNAEFVMVSAYNDFENVRTFFKQTGFDYILKPIDQEELQPVLERLSEKLSRIKPQSFDEDSYDPITENPVFNNLVQYVNGHFGEKITLDSLSKEFNYSRNYICRLFQKNTNKSLNLYLTEVRMEHAADLLKDKTILVKDVAALCGYPNYYHFFKVFKEHYGYSPKEYRESES